MSTTYYELRPPWSSIKVSKGGGHAHVKLWDAGALAGELAILEDHLGDVLYSLRGEQVCTRFWGGEKRGPCLQVAAIGPVIIPPTLVPRTDTPDFRERRNCVLE